MAVTSTTATPAQRAWAAALRKRDDLRPLRQEALDISFMTWDQMAKASVDWFEFWAMDAHLAIQKNNPVALEGDTA